MTEHRVSGRGQPADPIRGPMHDVQNELIDPWPGSTDDHLKTVGWGSELGRNVFPVPAVPVSYCENRSRRRRQSAARDAEVNRCLRSLTALVVGTNAPILEPGLPVDQSTAMVPVKSKPRS